MVSRLYRGSKLLQLAGSGRMVTRSQSGKQAVKAIINKYGKVVKSAYYYYRGDGNWTKWNRKRDARKKTSRVYKKRNRNKGDWKYSKKYDGFL